MKKKGDVKFIIYQSLYIFVVCVIAIKGANLDLVQVIENDGTPKARISEDSLNKLMQILKVAQIVDTSRFAIVDKNLLKENKELRDLVQLTKMNLSVSSISPMITQPTITQPEIKKDEEKIEEPKEISEIRIGNISLTQYTNNTLNNPYDQPLEVVGITTIPPKSTKSFVTGGEGSIVIRVGSTSKTVELKPNQKPKISFQRVTSMGEEARVSQLQRSVCYRVVVDDDFPGQLDVKFSGPITVKQQGNTYDITMNAFGSKSAFDNFTDGKDSPYSLGFTVTVSDKIAGHKITGQNSFIFGEW